MTTPPTPTKAASGVTASQIAMDITKFGGPVIAVLVAVMNLVPSASVPAGWQAILSAVVALLTAVQSVVAQKQVVAAKAEGAAALAAAVAAPRGRI